MKCEVPSLSALLCQSTTRIPYNVQRLVSKIYNGGTYLSLATTLDSNVSLFLATHPFSVRITCRIAVRTAVPESIKTNLV